jgi:NADPH-dependent 2,4-dienoyl-CoA reductase/sulfur reductase-like enzyme
MPLYCVARHWNALKPSNEEIDPIAVLGNPADGARFANPPRITVARLQDGVGIRGIAGCKHLEKITDVTAELNARRDVIIGAGPAGLAAALYLARYRRDILVLHDGKSRAPGIRLAHRSGLATQASALKVIE